MLPNGLFIRYDQIDEEHEQLVQVLNATGVHVGEGRNEEALQSLQDYQSILAHHFEHEETEMDSVAYPGLDWHKEHHRECFGITSEMLRHARKKGFVDDEVLDELFHGVVMDIARADLKFAEYLIGIEKI